MPKVMVWIRKEDWEKWQGIAGKPAWLHEKLNEKHGIRRASQLKLGQAKGSRMRGA